MEGFLHSKIITLDTPVGKHIDMKTIGKPIMSNIMAHGSNNHGQLIKFSEPYDLCHLTLIKKITCHQHHVGPMQIIMVRNRSAVSQKDLL
jgi:hypothetical protein